MSRPKKAALEDITHGVHGMRIFGKGVVRRTHVQFPPCFEIDKSEVDRDSEVVAAPAADVAIVEQVDAPGGLSPIDHGEGGAHRPISVEHAKPQPHGLQFFLRPRQGHRYLPT